MSKPTYEVPLRKTYQHKLHNGIVVVNGKMPVEAKSAASAKNKVQKLMESNSLQTVDPRIKWDYDEACSSGLCEWDSKHDCPEDFDWEYQDFSFVVAN